MCVSNNPAHLSTHSLLEPDSPTFPDVTQPPAETLNVSLPRIQLMFEVENLDYNVPRLCVKSVVKAELHDWSKQVSRANQHSLNLIFSSFFFAFLFAVCV